jgi:UDPglucose--hexose-1-phosphate uridylyltransferase
MTWEERWHPLRREWVIVAAHRQNRPWSGETIAGSGVRIPEYAADCYLCPGNARVSGNANPNYSDVFVFDNDHPCVGPDAPAPAETGTELYATRRAQGVARVVCYTPRHDLTLAELELDQIESLLRTWQDQYRELGARPEIEHVLVFENKGDVVGVSNPHPHCQIYATNFVYKTIETEVDAACAHLERTGRVLFGDVIAAERRDGRRILDENDSAVAFLPYFARYAYETYVAPKRSAPSLSHLDAAEIAAFARCLKNVLVRYDNLWNMPFPYVMALHQAPTDGKEHPEFHFHIEFHPPLRKPNLLKYLAGPEIGGGCFLSDTSPEQKAEELKNAGTVHYKRGARE